MPLTIKSRLALIASAGVVVSLGTFACAGQSPAPSTAGSDSAQPAPTAAIDPLAPIPNKGFAQKNGMLLIYPREGSVINAPTTFFVGAVPPGSTLTLNGVSVRVNAQGYFAQTAPLKRGENTFQLARNGQTGDALTVKVKRPGAAAALSSVLTMDNSSAMPREDVGVSVGDLVPFSVRAAAGSAVAVQIGARRIPLSNAPKSKVNLGLNTTFGVTYQAGEARDPNLYAGFYRVQSGDAWDKVQPKFVASKDGKTVQFVSPKHITVISQPRVLQTAHDDTIVRVGPGQGRTTPLPQGVRMLVDGFFGDQTRCALEKDKHVWIAREDLQEDSDPGRAPASTVRTLNLGTDTLSLRLTVPLDQRLPFQIEQKTPSKLVLKIFGATADTDWVGAEPPARSNGTDNFTSHGDGATATGSAQTGGAVGGGGGLAPGSSEEAFAYTDGVTWNQERDGVYTVTVNLKQKQQWGFWADYDGTNLVLHSRKAPKGGLRDMVICVDPGHGGKETGAFGCSGVRESQINLQIGLRLKEQLEQAGAKVVMTRTTDDVDVSLQDRVNTAIACNANLLISVHNNSLPDGRDPWKERGTSTYYYQPQSLTFARNLKDGVVSATGFPDFGTRWQNLALCRPSKMLACLVEVGFMIHPDEYAQLLQPSLQKRAAQGIVSGIKKFIATSANTPPAQPTGAPPAIDSPTEE